MAQEYNLIRKRVKEDPATAGDQAEESWATILRNWLPENYPVVTKGRIVDSEGFASPQVDVVVLHPSYPLSLRNNKMYFAGGVVAVFECKLTLRNEYLRKAIDNALIIKSMTPSRNGTPYDELHQPIIFGLLAHSHSWGEKVGENIDNLFEDFHGQLFKALDESDDSRKHPRYLIDCVCIADLVTIILHESIIVNESTVRANNFNNALQLETHYFSTSPSTDRMPYQLTLASLINNITTRLAFEDASLRNFAEYLQNTDIWKSIGPRITWSGDILSDDVVSKMLFRVFEKERWSKWNLRF